jgi:hypothetical protein
MHTTTPDTRTAADFPTLAAIAMAAHRCGDRDLLRFAREKLRDQYGVRLTFDRPAPPIRPRGGHAMTPLLSIDAAAEILDATSRQILALVEAGELAAVDVAVHTAKPGRITCAYGVVRLRHKRRLRITAESLRDFVARRSIGPPKAVSRRRKPDSHVIQFF